MQLPSQKRQTDNRPLGKVALGKALNGLFHANNRPDEMFISQVQEEYRTGRCNEYAQYHYQDALHRRLGCLNRYLARKGLGRGDYLRGMDVRQLADLLLKYILIFHSGGNKFLALTPQALGVFNLGEQLG